MADLILFLVSKRYWHTDAKIRYSVDVHELEFDLVGCYKCWNLLKDACSWPHQDMLSLQITTAAPTAAEPHVNYRQSLFPKEADNPRRRLF